MTRDEVLRLQQRLGVTADGVLGPITYAALFSRVAGRNLGERGLDLGRGAAKHFNSYAINTPLRVAHFLAQASHETGGFKYLRELWGPTPAQKRYEGRRDLGNCIPGDGRRFMGRGIFQLTGRANYEKFGKLCGLDFACQPDLVENPEVGLHVACEYWKQHSLNVLADFDDVERITRKINGGLNGFEDRKKYLARAKAVLL